MAFRPNKVPWGPFNTLRPLNVEHQHGYGGQVADIGLVNIQRIGGFLVRAEIILRHPPDGWQAAELRATGLGEDQAGRSGWASSTLSEMPKARS